MKPGLKGELRCLKYLKDNYENEKITFRHDGGMDSTKSDILVMKRGRDAFYVEVKASRSQAGQFVLFPDEDKKEFVFSPSNTSKRNKSADAIIKYMNDNFDRFANAGTAGETIHLDQNIFAHWLIEYYKNKDAKYILSYNSKDYVVFPIRKLEEYFDINAKYRIRKSGSRKLPNKDFYIAEQKIAELYPDARFYIKKDRLFVNIPEKIKNKKFVIGNYTYFLSSQENNDYEVRKLSNTNNKSVIFTLKLKKPQDVNDYNKFEQEFR